MGKGRNERCQKMPKGAKGVPGADMEGGGSLEQVAQQKQQKQ